MLARITVTTTDGRTLFAEGDAGRGHPANPMSDDEVGAKFTDCARWGGLAGDGAALRALVEVVRGGETSEQTAAAIVARIERAIPARVVREGVPNEADQ